MKNIRRSVGDREYASITCQKLEIRNGRNQTAGTVGVARNLIWVGINILGVYMPKYAPVATPLHLRIVSVVYELMNIWPVGFEAKKIAKMIGIRLERDRSEKYKI